MYYWNEFTAENITRAYLIGETGVPFRYDDPDYVRAPGSTLRYRIDAVSFMDDGPGRFANAALIDVVSDFINGGRVDSTGERKTYSVADLLKPGEKANLGIQQYNFNDSQNDILMRTWVWNSSGFTIAGDAVFIIEADGSRHIKNFALLPFDDNFDFESDDGLAAITNPISRAYIDPWGIGRKVSFSFDEGSKMSIPRLDYTFDSYKDDVFRANSQYNLEIPASLASGAVDFIMSLWSSDAISSFDWQGRPIIYGSTGNDNLTPALMDKLPPGHPLYAAKVTGYALVDGGGNDTLTGSEYSDNLQAGSGKDTLLGGKGADALQGGSGADHLDGQSGADYLDGGTEDDLLAGGDDNDQIWGGEGDDVLMGEHGNDELIGGSGFDTYQYYTGDGFDTIDDWDGVVMWDDIVLTGGHRVAYGVYVSDDGKHTYRAGANSSIIVDDVLTIKSFGYNSFGEHTLGIVLDDGESFTSFVGIRNSPTEMG